MWVYQQSTGILLHDGEHIAVGYSGHAEGVNNPLKESERNVGPIPEGVWTIGDAFQHPTKGPVCMRLTPTSGRDPHGRNGFMIHGDNSKMDRSASEGCIILSRSVRVAISNSPDRDLLVIA